MQNFLVVVLLMIIMSGCLFANWIEEQRLIPSDNSYRDKFGSSVSIFDNYAIVGAPNASDNGNVSGAAYIYFFDGLNWIEQQKLIPSDNMSGDKFGISVSISNNFSIIGAHWDDDDDNGNSSGSAYIYYFDGTIWIEQQKLTASDAAATDNFGNSVSISDDYVIIGAQSENCQQGSAYIFYNNGSSWIEQQKLIASDCNSFDQFGCAVSISGDYAVIGAYQNITNYTMSGAAYIFHNSGSNWTEQQILVPSDGSNYDRFGCAVSIDGANALIGARYHGESSTGSAYIFHNNESNWIEEQKLTPLNGVSLGNFGKSVSIKGNYAFVGYASDDFGSGSTYNYHYSGSNWINQQIIIASDGSDDDGFGWSVSISDDYVIIGAPHNDDNGDNSGSAYIFKNEGLYVEENFIQNPLTNISLTNYPNPFNPTTVIEFSILNNSEIDLAIFNINGQKIKTLIQNDFMKGKHSIIWNGDDKSGKAVSSGIYYYKKPAP